MLRGYLLRNINGLNMMSDNNSVIYSLLGKGMYIRFSSLLRRASSMSHGKLVAASTITILVGSSFSPVAVTPVNI